MSELNPMDEKVQLFLEEIDEATSGLYPFDSNKRGKWMLFYKSEYMNKMWQLALSLYRTGELTGVISVKCSTAAPNPRATGLSEGAIRFACGPYDDEMLVLSYGKNLTEKMQYFNERGYVAYKTDEQTAKGTRATGAKRNFFYRIPVPTVDHLATGSDLYNTLGITPEATQQEITKAYRRTALKVHPDKNKDDPTAEEKFKQLGAAYETLGDQHKRANYDRNKSSSNERPIEMPCRTYTKGWLFEIDDDIALQYYMELSLLGRWILIFNKHQLDAAWSKACRLYRDNKLTGISFLKVTTVKKIRVQRNVPTGIIVFYCGPHDNEELVQSYGRNLCKEMSYVSYRDTVDFKVDREDLPSQTLYKINTI